MSPIWTSTSHFYSTDTIETNMKSPSSSSDAIDNESTCKNLSKMRTYLKRCENAINNINISVKRSPTTHSASTSSDGFDAKQSNSSWYIDELEAKSTDNHNESNRTDNKSNQQTVVQPPYSTLDEQANKVNDDRINGHIQKIECMTSTYRIISVSRS